MKIWATCVRLAGWLAIGLYALASPKLPRPGAGVDLWAFEWRRLTLYVVAVLAVALLIPASAALAALVNRAFGDRITALSIGSGPVLGSFRFRDALVTVHLKPLAWRHRGPESYHLSLRHRLVVAVAPLPFVLLIPLAPPDDRTMLLIAWTFGLLIWLFLPPTKQAQRARVMLLFRPRTPQPGTPAAGLATCQRLLQQASDGQVAQVRQELSGLDTTVWPRQPLSLLRQFMGLADADYEAVIQEADAALNGARGQVTPSFHQYTSGVLASAVALAAEDGRLPLPDALSRLDGLLAQLPEKETSGARAVRATLVGDWEQAARLSRRTVRRTTGRVSLADELCTLAVAEAGCHRRREAESALRRARALAPAYPRLDVARRKLDLNDPRVPTTDQGLTS